MRSEPRKQLKELAKKGDLAGVQHLLDTVEKWIYYALETALIEAAREGHLPVATALLDAGADPDGIAGHNSGLLTPLHAAAHKRNGDMMALLLAHGAKTDVLFSDTGETPLHQLLGRGYQQSDHLPLVRRLLDAGADPNRQASIISKQANFTPFQWALRHDARETALLLLEHGADINQRNGNFATALMLATERAINDDDLTLLDWLLELGADPNAMEHESNKTPLTLAANRGQLGLIEYLVQAGADVTKGHPLAEAAEHGHVDAARRLLDLGANANDKTVLSYAALIAAITKHNTAMAKLLIDYGAAFEEPTKTYKGTITPLEFARDDPKYNADIIDYMLTHIAARDAERARQEAGRYYAAGLVKVARDPRTGKSIAHWLEQGADPNSTNEYGRTALHYVAERGKSPGDACLLLDAGADPNARDPFGYTPLHDSVLGNNADIIQALLEAGAKPDAHVERGIHHGYTALEIARIERKKHAIRLLEPISPEPRPLTPCEPEFRRNGSVKGFSHVHYEEDAEESARARKGERGTNIYMCQTSRRRKWVEKRNPQRYTEPCVRTIDYDIRSQYRGTGIVRAEHPLRWRMAMEGCLHCGSEDVLVIYADWGVQPHSGDAAWSYEVKCTKCGYYSSWGYDDS